MTVDTALASLCGVEQERLPFRVDCPLAASSVPNRARVALRHHAGEPRLLSYRPGSHTKTTSLRNVTHRNADNFRSLVSNFTVVSYIEKK